jgi:hypothetical protein
MRKIERTTHVPEARNADHGQGRRQGLANDQVRSQ